jgi:hypothetical protein
MTEIRLTSSAATEDIAHVRAVIDATMEEEERVSIRKWLHPDGVESEAHFTAALNQRHPDTGKWLLYSKGFKEWSLGKHSCMWIYGIGKQFPLLISMTVS